MAEKTVSEVAQQIARDVLRSKTTDKEERRAFLENVHRSLEGERIIYVFSTIKLRPYQTSTEDAPVFWGLLYSIFRYQDKWRSIYLTRDSEGRNLPTSGKWYVIEMINPSDDEHLAKYGKGQEGLPQPFVQFAREYLERYPEALLVGNPWKSVQEADRAIPAERRWYNKIVLR